MSKTQAVHAAGRIVTLALILTALVVGPCLAASDYVGTWKASDKDGTFTLIIKNDGTAAINFEDKPAVKLSWSEDDNGIVLKSTEQNVTLKGHFLEDGETLRLSDGTKPMDFKQK